MSAYTSVKGGNWNDPATWGSASYPSIAGDTATIAAGHTVIYNVVSTVEMGQITITGGLLSFSTAMTTKLTMGYQDIIININGELRVGTLGAIIPKQYTASILWNTTGDNNKGISCSVGSGKISICGDPAYYGSIDNSTLAADWASGSTFTIIGDFSTKWNIGDELTVHRKRVFSATVDDLKLVTIKTLTLSGGNTIIEVNEAYPFTVTSAPAGGRVQNVSRNVKLGKLGASTVIGDYNTNRPRIYWTSLASDHNVKFNDAQFTGFYYIQIGNNLEMTNCIVRNSYRVMYAGTGHVYLGGAIYSCNYGPYVQNTFSGDIALYGNLNAVYNCYKMNFSGPIYANANGPNNSFKMTSSGDAYSNSVAFTFCHDSIISSNIYLNAQAAIRDSINCLISGCVYSNAICFVGCPDLKITGRIGYDALGNLSPNTTDMQAVIASVKNIIYMRGMIHPAFVFSGRNSTQYDVGIYSEDDGQSPNNSIYYAQFGTVQQNAGVHNLACCSLKTTPLTQCAAINIIEIVNWKEYNVPTSAQSRRVYVRGDAWISFPTSAELYIEAEYYNAAGAWTTTTKKSTEVLTVNGAWVALTLDFVPARIGQVIYRIVLAKYEAGASVYLDHALYYSATEFLGAAFDWGKSVLPMAPPPTFPAVANVRALTAYGTPLVSQVGVLDLPAVGNVRAGVQFDSLTKLGLLDIPAIGDVRSGTKFDQLSKTGILDLPSEIDVRDGTHFDQALKEGLLDLPVEDDVRDGILFDGDSKEGILDLPAVADVKDGVIFDNGSKEGSYAPPIPEYPDADDVRDGIEYGGGLEGNLVLPSESQVLLDTPFGAAGNEFTGKLGLGSPELSLAAAEEIELEIEPQAEIILEV